MNNKLVIFDFFGVICSEIAPFWFANHFEKKEAIKLKEKFFVPADLGEISLEDVFKKISLEYKFPINDIKNEWYSYIKIDFELVDYIKKIRNFADVVLISNAPSGFVENLIDTYKLNDLFDYIFISSQLHISKPDIRIYNHCLKTLNKSYTEMYMIDDNPKNLLPLPSLGIQPIVYKTIDDVKKVFLALSNKVL